MAQGMVVTWATLATTEALNTTPDNVTQSPVFGSSLPRARGVLGPAAGHGPEDGPGEYGGRTSYLHTAGAHAHAEGTPAPSAPAWLGDTTAQSTSAQNGDSPTHGTPANAPHRPGTPATSTQAANTQARSIRKNTKASIKVATLNMRGKETDKWNHINQMVRDKRIGVLAVQETHLTGDHVDHLHHLFSKRLHIISTIDEAEPNSKGVAIVLNKEITNVHNVESTVIVQARALLVVLPWHQGEKLSILAVYAPNSPTANENFWKEVKHTWQMQRLPKVDILLGDFNLVEDAVDRIPSHADNVNTVEALNEVKHMFQLQDGWRNNNPAAKAYTYLQSHSGSQSRIDRIYVSRTILKNSYEWKAETTGIPTDHKMVSMLMTTPLSPHIGKGRWSIPLHLLKEKAFKQEIKRQGLVLERDIQLLEGAYRSQSHNPQTLLKEFKEKVIKIAKVHAKASVPRLEKKIELLEKELKEVLNDMSVKEEERILSSLVIQEQITYLERKRHVSKRLNIEVRNKLEGETISKYWSQINKEKSPRDTIPQLKDPNIIPERYERMSHKMAELAKSYHDNLQRQGDPTAGPHYGQTVSLALGQIRRTAGILDQISLGELLQQEEVLAALRASPNGKASGLDGIPTELWKLLASQEQETAEQGPSQEQKVDIVKILTAVFNDIQRYGVAPQTDFAEGWMCPIYKKGDKGDIANYRPITVLNADYKTFTKALANKLTPVADKIIHQDQAGFLPGRSIFDQVKLCKLLISYAESEERNGAIVALDQEKAYNKIAHKYLWEALKKFKIHSNFISTIRSIYNNAKTTVIINGVKSDPFAITRGVRQGDPLSCLLFNLAIEPLAISIRESNIRGYRLPNTDRILKTSLFADDTTVYLSQRDDFQELQALLDAWCGASGAKFNISKTEIIPIGTPEHRKAICETRKLSPNQQPIVRGIHIASDGEPTRILGAWIGNGIEQSGVWSRILDDVEARLQQWAKSHPTMEGRRLIVQMVIAGTTQYLTKVQGMPRDIEKRLTKRIRTFVWDSEGTPPINTHNLTLPKSQGGRKLLDLSARNKAIQLTWLKAYALQTPQRPIWAYIADELIRKNVTTRYKTTDPSSRVNFFTQSWKASIQRLPQDLREMVKVAKEFHVAMELLQPSEGLKRKLPVWLHAGANGLLLLMNNNKEAKCLRNNHRVKEVGQLLDITERQDRSHKARKNCPCQKCKDTRAESSCPNPHKCNKMAGKILDTLYPKWNPLHRAVPDGLDLTPRRKQRNKEAQENGGPIVFDPCVMQDSMSHTIRIFTQPGAKSHLPALRRPRPNHAENPETVIVYTDGSCIKNGEENAQAGSGVWYGHNDPGNKALRVPGPDQSNQTGELYAVLQVAKNTPTHVPLLIKSDSKYVIEGLTERLEEWEDKGWIGVTNHKLFKTTAAWLRIRNSQTAFQWVKGHNGEEGNEEADRLAAEGAMKPAIEHLDLALPENFNLTGANLSTMSQSTLYQGIINQNPPRQRLGTTMHLDIARYAVESMNGCMPSDMQIWRSLGNKCLTRQAREFLWRCMHKAYKCGSYWDNIPNHEQRAKCPVCQTEESMEHILTECDAPGQRIIWKLAEALWAMKFTGWPQMKYGIILGGGLANFKTPGGKPDTGKNRLFQVLVSESTFLIWKIRCERRFQRRDDAEMFHSRQEVHNRWVAAINKRLIQDCLSTNKRRYGRKATGMHIVSQTWRGVLHDQRNLPEDWIQQAGVLVGIRPLRPPGRNR